MNEGGWYDCDKIRFRFGVPEKMNGWQRYSDSQFLGICRKLHNWIALDQSNYVALGTHLKLYIEEGTQYYDITPFRAAAASLSTDALETNAAGSKVITVTQSSHGAVTNDFVTIAGAATFDGITAAELNTEHQVTVVDGNTYTITVASDTASSGNTAGGGASITARFQINTGLDTIVSGTGWGAGQWGGTTAADPATTLNGALNADTAGTGGSGTSVVLTDASGFPSAGSIVVNETEVIAYTGKTSNTLTGITRGQDGSTATAGTGVAHANGATVRGAAAITGWGDASSLAATSGSEARIWTLDNFGEDLLACVRDGELFYWDKTNGLSTRADKLTARSGADQVPTIARQVMVSDRSRHCIAFACNAQGSSDQDPLLIRFSKAENAVDWNILTAGTDAGDLIIGSGSKFVSAIETKREILVWTDVSLHSMQFIGAPNTFGLIQIASGLSIVGPNAVVAVNDQVFWMGENQFYLYDGRTQQIPCTVRDYVFDDINNDQRELVTAGLNSAYYEVFWFYPSKNSTEVDKYVVFNYSEQVWYFGTLARTAWIDAEIRSYPVAAAPDRYLYNHELGNDDGSTSPATAIQAFIESSPLSMESGDQFQLIRRVIPDVTFDGSEQATPTVTFTLQGYDKPGQGGQDSVNGTVTKEVSDTVEKYTDELFLRLRGRSFSVKIQNTGTGTQWRLGIPRVDVRPDGRR
tara:strand:+ start:1687 stop:3774 length:2088 start_codon:yes stop_codon:yes gene_type:complete